MFNHGLKQSSRLIFDNPHVGDYYLRRSIDRRISKGKKIDEVWLREENGEINRFYPPKTED